MLCDFHDCNFAPWFEGDADSVIHWDDTEQSHTPYFVQHFENAVRQNALCPQYLPLTKRLVNVRATLFHRKPAFELIRGGVPLPADHEQTQLWDRIVRSSQLIPALKRWQRRSDLVGTALMFPRWNGRGLQMEVYTPDWFYAAQSANAPADLNRCDFVMHELAQAVHTIENAAERRFAVWEPPQKEGGQWACFVRGIDGRNLENPLFANNVNRYGRFPYVIAHREPPEFSILAEPDDSLITAQVGINLLYTDYMGAMFMQGGVLAVQDHVTGRPRDIPFSRYHALNIPPGSEFGAQYIKMDIDIGGMIAFAANYLKIYAVMHGLHPDTFSIEGEAFASAITAVAKQVDRLDVQETREDSEAYWELILDDLFDLIRAVWNVHVPNDPLDADLELRIKWPEPQEVADPLAATQAAQARLNAHLSYRVREIMRIHRCDELEAKRIFELALDEAGRLAGEAPGIRQTPESETDFQHD